MAAPVVAVRAVSVWCVWLPQCAPDTCSHRTLPLDTSLVSLPLPQSRAFSQKDELLKATCSSPLWQCRWTHSETTHKFRLLVIHGRTSGQLSWTSRVGCGYMSWVVDNRLDITSQTVIWLWSSPTMLEVADENKCRENGKTCNISVDDIAVNGSDSW